MKPIRVPTQDALFAAVFSSVEDQLRASLSVARGKYEHRGEKGVDVESAVRDVLREYLPRIYGIGHGEIIDSHGRRSAQTDIVITNPDHPFTFMSEKPGLFVVEGVSAVGEVKAVLTSTGLNNAIANSRQFKQLNVEPGKYSLTKSNESDIARYHRCPPYFLFAIESQLTIEKVADIVEKAAAEDGPILDAIFPIDRGYAIDFGDGQGAFKATSGGQSAQGWGWLDEGRTLFTMFAWLSAVMPRIVRFEPILPRYLLGVKE